MVQILLLEDEQDFASNLKEIIEIDLVVADLFIKKDDQFERQGGLTLISTVRKIIGSDIPIIAISGGFSPTWHKSPHMAMTAVESSKVVGATVALAKPFHPQELLDMIDDLLGHP